MYDHKMYHTIDKKDSYQGGNNLLWVVVEVNEKSHSLTSWGVIEWSIQKGQWKIKELSKKPNASELHINLNLNPNQESA